MDDDDTHYDMYEYLNSLSTSHAHLPLAGSRSVNSRSNHMLTIPEERTLVIDTRRLNRTTSVNTNSVPKDQKKGALVSICDKFREVKKEVKTCIKKKTTCLKEKKKNSFSWMKCLRPPDAQQLQQQGEQREIQVAPAQEESSETGWVPDVNELQQWKEMADRIRCPLIRGRSRRERQSDDHED